MTIIPIASAQDPRLVDYTDLTDVALRSRTEPERGLYMAESPAVIERALAVGHRPRSFLLADRWLEPTLPLLEAAGSGEAGEVPVYVGSLDLLREVTGFTMHRGALAAMQRPTLPAPAELLVDARRVIVLEDIVDHTNVGAIFRSVAALGADAVLVTPRCADPLYRRSVRVSMGTVFQVPWTRIPAWPDSAQLLRDAGFTVAAMALTPSAVDLDAWDVPDRVAIVMGTEGHGLTPSTLSAVDLHVRIPMSGGVDSLNVASAAAVVMWQVRRRADR